MQNSAILSILYKSLNIINYAALFSDKNKEINVNEIFKLLESLSSYFHF